MGALAQRSYWLGPVPRSAALSSCLSVALFFCSLSILEGYGVSRWSVLLASSFGAVAAGALFLAILPTLIVTWITGLVLSLPDIFIQRFQVERLQNHRRGRRWQHNAITVKDSVVVKRGKELATDIIIRVAWTILALVLVGSALLMDSSNFAHVTSEHCKWMYCALVLVRVL